MSFVPDKIDHHYSAWYNALYSSLYRNIGFLLQFQLLGGRLCPMHVSAGASGLSLLPSSWAIDLKMLVPFYLGQRNYDRMSPTVIQDSALTRIKEIHNLSQRYNSQLDHTHTDKLLTLIRDHSEEIKELHQENNLHYLTETGDLIILCFELLLEAGVCIDDILIKCFGRYETKLPKLIKENTL